jgi:multiple sugar transport system permease protein
MVLPFVWMVSTSLKDAGQAFAFPPRWIPAPFVWDNYPSIFRSTPFALFLWNSFVVSGMSTVGQLLSCSMAGFAFSRLRWPGRDLLFLLLLATIMIPFHITIIPVFVIMKKLGWINTFLPLILPNFLGGAFGTFLMRQFFLTLPGELADAARIDGCSWRGIYWRIFLPLAKPALATLAVFTFMAAWNDLLGPLIFLNSMEKYTVSIGLTFFQGQHEATFWPQLMAASLVSISPLIVLYVSAQKYFIQGIATSGLNR